MLVLGIETSCDDTAVALYDSEAGIIGQLAYSQIDLHNAYGGVVPELASRAHEHKLLPLVQSLLTQTKTSLSGIDCISYTKGPGLIGALLVGGSFAKSLAFGLEIPSIGVHHIEAHLLIALQEHQVDFPFLGLVVSGGHTLLVDAKGLGQYTILGQTKDDAAGEAFDKTAKLMGLPYPGGPEISAHARDGRENAFQLPRPMSHTDDYHFSFSGLKTQVRLTWESSAQDKQAMADLARALEEAIVDSLLIKVKKALSHSEHSTLIIAGGVSANSHLRTKAQSLCDSLGVDCYFPKPSYCTDNGAMIAYTGFRYFSEGHQDTNSAIDVVARWPIDKI